MDGKGYLPENVQGTKIDHTKNGIYTDRGVMVTVVRNTHDEPSSNPGGSYFYFT